MLQLPDGKQLPAYPGSPEKASTTSRPSLLRHRSSWMHITHPMQPRSPGGWHKLQQQGGSGLGMHGPCTQVHAVSRRRYAPNVAPDSASPDSKLHISRYSGDRAIGVLDGLPLGSSQHLSMPLGTPHITSSSWDISLACPTRTAILEVNVQNFALVEQQRLEFGPGLNVVTGESGSGKSVLVESLAQLLGGAAPTECVRAGADMAVVEGMFLMSAATARAVREVLSEEGVPRKALPPPERGQLHLRREILRSEGSPAGSRAGSSDGSSSNPTAPTTTNSKASLRSRCYVNGSPVTLRTLRALSSILVDMNGQHSSIALREGSTQLALLDKVAGSSHLAAKVAQLVSSMSKVESQLEALDALSDPKEREQRRKLVEAVKRVKLQAGEEVELRQQVRALEASRHMAEQCAAARAALAGDGTGGGVVSAVKSLETQLRATMPRGALKRGSPGPVVPGARVVPTPNNRVRSITPTNGYRASTPPPPPVMQADPAVEATEDAGEVEAGDEEEEEEDAVLGPLEQALDALAAARQQLMAAEMLVKTAARQSSQDMLDYDDKSERLQLIDKLLRSQRVRSTDELLAVVDQAQQQLEQYEDMVEHAEEWEETLESLRVQLLDTCMALTAARRAAAPRLAEHLEACLAELAMGGARVHVAVSWQPESSSVPLRECEAIDVPDEQAQQHGEVAGMYRVRPGEAGLDKVELLLAAGPGEPLRPLSAVASGGESARIMLALKAAPSAIHGNVKVRSNGYANGRGSSNNNGFGGEGNRYGTDFANGLMPAAGVSVLQSSLSGVMQSVNNGAPTSFSKSMDAAAVDPSLAPITPVMVLDELDSGIGSRLGANVGAMLRRMAGEVPVADHGAPLPLNPGSQIICVTHLPQVAAYASHHIKVVKMSGTRVTTCFEVLKDIRARASEVADMMGMEVTLAEDMLRTAQGTGLPAGGKEGLAYMNGMNNVVAGIHGMAGYNGMNGSNGKHYSN